MILSKEAIEEFKQIYKKEFKEELTDQEAYERATRLLEFYKLLYKIHKTEKDKNK